MKVIGITGSLASGKSEVADIFRRKGAQVFDADTAARRALAKGTPTYAAVLKLFGRGYLKKGGRIDRKKLAWHVFSNPADLRKLNILIHPGVIFDCLKVISRHRRRKGLLVLDVPLLFESHMQNLGDCTVVVTAGRRRILERARAKGIPGELARKILSTQWPLSKKVRQADFVIRNDGSKRDLEKQVLAVIQKIQTSSGQ